MDLGGGSGDSTWHLLAAVLAAVMFGPSATATVYLFIGMVTAVVVSVVLAFRDARKLQAAGIPFSSRMAWWCLLGGWAYVVARAVKRPNRGSIDWVLVGASLAAWLVLIVISTPVINSVITSSSVFERAHVESQIASGIERQTGEASVSVDCPADPPLSPGSQFQCVATASDGSTAMVTVTVQDRTGDVTWETTG